MKHTKTQKKSSISFNKKPDGRSSSRPAKNTQSRSNTTVSESRSNTRTSEGRFKSKTSKSRPATRAPQGRFDSKTSESRSSYKSDENTPPQKNQERPKTRPTAKAKDKNSAPKLSGLWLHGLHPIKAGLLNPKRKILELRVTDEAYALLPENEIAKQSVDVKIYDKSDISKMVPAGTLHQGMIARCEPLPYKTIDDIVAELEPDTKSTIVILDQVTDPHNVGAILRSAAVFGATAVVVPDKNAPEETGVLAKSASGALEKIDYIRSGNLKRTIDILKGAGFWCVGFSGDSQTSLQQFKPDSRTVIIMGAEGTGMRRLTKESCDHLLKIDMVGSDEILDSLNVSNATAIALYEITK